MRCFLRGSLGLMENEFDEWTDDLGDHTDRKLRNSPDADGQLPRGVYSRLRLERRA